MKLKHISLLFTIIIIFSCNIEPYEGDIIEEGIEEIDETEKEINQEYSIDGVKHSITKGIAYSEGDSSVASFYYFDLTFLSENVDYVFPQGNEQFNQYNGQGNIFELTVLSNSKTYIAEGDYTLSSEDDGEDEPYEIWSYPMLYTDFNFSENNISNLPFSDYNEFSSLKLNFKREGDIYTITGTGTLDNGKVFNIFYKGGFIFDPDSEI